MFPHQRMVHGTSNLRPTFLIHICSRNAFGTCVFTRVGLYARRDLLSIIYILVIPSCFFKFYSNSIVGRSSYVGWGSNVEHSPVKFFAFAPNLFKNNTSYPRSRCLGPYDLFQFLNIFFIIVKPSRLLPQRFILFLYFLIFYDFYDQLIELFLELGVLLVQLLNYIGTVAQVNRIGLGCLGCHVFTESQLLAGAQMLASLY